MTEPSLADWPQRYSDLIEALPQLVSTARLTLCGMSACMDARISMHDMQALLGARDPQAIAFAETLVRRAQQGIGGEFPSHWTDGPSWLAAHVPVSYSLGGTGPHAAWVLATLGAPALLCLEDRSTHMLANVHPGILLAEGDAVKPAEAIIPHGERRPDIFIFEYTAGLAIGAIVPDRSSRIIVRFHNPGLENDAAYDHLTQTLASTAGAGLLAGFNAVPRGQLAREIDRVFGMARGWQEEGLGLVHLEMAGYDSLDLVETVFAGARGAISSIGMSQSELEIIDGRAGTIVDAMLRLGERLQCARVCVHADHWAASVMKHDPARERQALMTGCLLASVRAAAGRPVRPASIAPAAEFHAPPFAEEERHGDWTLVSCASPYLARPVTTLGLGDTFTAGCLLALGRPPTEESARPRSPSQPVGPRPS